MVYYWSSKRNSAEITDEVNKIMKGIVIVFWSNFLNVINRTAEVTWVVTVVKTKKVGLPNSTITVLRRTASFLFEVVSVIEGDQKNKGDIVKEEDREPDL